MPLGCILIKGLEVVILSDQKKQVEPGDLGLKSKTKEVEVHIPEVVPAEGTKKRILVPKPSKNKTTKVMELSSDSKKSDSTEVIWGEEISPPTDVLSSTDTDLLVLDPLEVPDHSEDELESYEIPANEPGLVTSSPLQRYLSEIRRYPLLTREEERSIATEAFEKQDPKAKSRLVTANLRLVVKIAMEYRRAYSQILDLIQEGNAGLIQAVNKFNPYRGVKLSTYSAWWIRAYILKFLMDNKSLVRMGTTDAQRKLFFRLRGEAERLYAQTQKFDTLLLAERLGVKEADVIEMHQRLSKSDMSLDQTVGDDSDTRHVDVLASDQESSYDSLERQQLLKILNSKINEVERELNERDLYIFRNRILADDPVTLQEVGEKYGVTRERARQLEVRLLKKVKEKFIEEI
jgi:RNA polymerase sigma-32 factor